MAKSIAPECSLLLCIFQDVSRHTIQSHLILFLPVFLKAILPFSVPISQLLSCSIPQDRLDQVKNYVPGDKYFKPSLVSLHFVMETSPIAEADTFFSQMITLYDLPIGAEGAEVS